jgi:hypothetical protein
LAPFRGTGGREMTAWLSQDWRTRACLGEESGLQACYGKPLHLQGFSISL